MRWDMLENLIKKIPDAGYLKSRSTKKKEKESKGMLKNPASPRIIWGVSGHTDTVLVVKRVFIV